MIATLRIVARSGPGVGAGHVGRCLALAQAWVAAGGRAEVDPDAGLPDDWRDRYRAAGVEVTATHPPQVVLVDGYDIDAGQVAAWRAQAPVVVIDDHGTGGARGADLVVDQNLGARADAYPGTRLLAGPRYALLRPDVVAARPGARPDRRAAPAALLVAAGGDPAPDVAASLDEAARTVADRHDLDVRWLRGVADVGSALAAADVALSAAGSTTWELLAHGVPTVLVPVVDNQRPVARAVGAAGAAVDAGDIATTSVAELVAALEALVGSPERRDELSAAGWALVDGRGAARVAASARALLVSLRRAGADDAEQLWRWANDPRVRAASFRPEPIAWEDHLAWFERTSSTSDAAIWLADDHLGEPLGQVRVDGAGTGTGTVDVSVAPERRGQGWAAPMLVAASWRAEAELGPHGLERLVAEVLPDNVRSSSAFLAADFDRGPDGTHEGRPHETYTRRCHGRSR